MNSSWFTFSKFIEINSNSNQLSKRMINFKSVQFEWIKVYFYFQMQLNKYQMKLNEIQSNGNNIKLNQIKSKKYQI